MGFVRLFRHRPGVDVRRGRRPDHLPHRPSDHRKDRSRRSRRAPRHPARHPHPGRHPGRAAGRQDQGVLRRHGSARGAGHHALPRRPRLQAAAAPGGHVDPRGRHRRHAGRPRRRRPLHRVARCARPWTRCATSAGPAPCSWRSSSTAATASCRCAPTTSARTCPPRAARTSRCGSSEDDGHDGVSIAPHGGPAR